MKKYFSFLLNLLFPALLFFCGCSTPAEPDGIPGGSGDTVRNCGTDLSKPVALVSIHTVVPYPDGRSGVGKVPAFAGPQPSIELTAWLTSAEIESAEAVERPNHPGVYDIILVLTPEGRRQWEKMLSGKAPEKFAFVVDGVFYRMFKPRRFYDNTVRTIVVDGPFDSVIAPEIAKNARLNYRKLKRKTLKAAGKPDGKSIVAF